MILSDGLLGLTLLDVSFRLITEALITSSITTLSENSQTARAQRGMRRRKTNPIES